MSKPGKSLEKLVKKWEYVLQARSKSVQKRCCS